MNAQPNTQSNPPAMHTPTLTASIGYTGASFHYDNCASHPLSFRIEYRDPALREEGNNLAQFIVRACNSHAQLVAALEGAAFNMDDTLDHLERLYESNNPYVTGLRHSITLARAALRAAQG